MLRYDKPVPPYTRTIPPGTAALRAVIRDRYGITRLEVVRSEERCSQEFGEHCVCRAIDAYTTLKPVRTRVFREMVAAAEDLGVQAVIADRRVWGYGTWVERGYTGPHPHDDHVHIGLNRDGAEHLTYVAASRVLARNDPPAPTPPPTAKEEAVVYIRSASASSGAIYRVGPVLEHVSADEWDAMFPKPDVLTVADTHPLYRRPKLLAADFDPR